MTNLQKFFRINNQLASEQREAFGDYFIGALSVLAEAKAWSDALHAATRNVEARHRVAVDRKELECQRCTEWPCICGNTNFEADNNMALRQAEEIE